MSQILDSTGDRPPLFRRAGIHLVVGAARVLSRLPPRRIVHILRLTRPGAAPATAEQTLRARQDVTGTSTRCSGTFCLPRSLATALLCRVRGTWPTWSSGVRTPPFAAHAWVEVDGQQIGEPDDAASYHTMLSVPPRGV